VFPGETLRTDIWKVTENILAFTLNAEERKETVISGGLVTTRKSTLPVRGAPQSGASRGADEVFSKLSKILENLPVEQRKDLMNKGNGIYRFEVKSGSDVASFYINLKDQNGSIGKGAPKSPDITIEIGEDSLIQLLHGNLKGQSAFMKGLIKVKGNMMLATKLDVILSALGTQFKSKL
jgi:putative sterol carrier protein